MGADCKKLGGSEIPKINSGGSYDAKENNNPYKPGPVHKWQMTPEELAEYVKKHPIVYREHLKPSPAFTMEKWQPEQY